ncbi:hypothetical protein CFIICLFH_4784 [Methylobacterium goesingense]|uniref:Uncharacterized protein n=1 Tax=Methylobacterium goesingense TaxID=243690 RepID=A0ABV2LCI4_9HYPH|nr:hypothetical protein CFIICLFH_4784 [Methylobacterium goesingense]
MRIRIGDVAIAPCGHNACDPQDLGAGSIRPAAMEHAGTATDRTGDLPPPDLGDVLAISLSERQRISRCGNLWKHLFHAFA